MKPTLKRHLYLIFAYVVSYIGAYLLSGTVFRTICNAIIEDENAALRVTRLLILFLTMIFAFILIYFYKRNTKDEYRKYITEMKEREYDLKNDFIESFKNKEVWDDAVIVSIITVIYGIRYFGFFSFLPFLNIPLFVLFEILANVLMHNSWLKEKDRF